ncbi:UNVERIFIED_CONTAM: Inositol oxygenase 1 [Sesamum radiatum]|uniref:Inositol oxygenase n=1 Tax=Sesamum radiatum TaxID=300843 RepID=A0AAW2R2X6_SESRA
MTVTIHDPFFYGSSDDEGDELFGQPVAEEQAPPEEEEPREIAMVEVGFFPPQNNAFGGSFRNYQAESLRRIIVEEFYRKNHTFQTYDFAMAKKEEYGRLNRRVMSIWECCELLNDYVDESDPDLDEPQLEHLLQTAEAIRRDYPDQDWLHLTALIHGDTFPLGCAFSEAIVHHKFFRANPDSRNPDYNTKLGIYIDNCGLENVTMSWGHDEYMYLVAKGNDTTLPPAALFIIRYHSFYALHHGGAYAYLMNNEDREMLEWLQVFKKYDLYSKSRVRINQEEVRPYYLSLIEKV